MQYVLFLLVFWLFWPGSMFIVGLIFESRILPFWKHQSRAFIPGDFCVGVMFLGIKILRDHGYNENDPLSAFTILLIVLAYSAAVVVQDKDIKPYKLRATRSPTKILNDSTYFLFPFLILYSGWPIIVAKTPYVSIFWGAVAAFAAAAVWDAKRGFTEEDVRLRHPDDWQPIWKTKKIRRY